MDIKVIAKQIAEELSLVEGRVIERVLAAISEQKALTDKDWETLIKTRDVLRDISVNYCLASKLGFRPVWQPILVELEKFLARRPAPAPTPSLADQHSAYQPTTPQDDEAVDMSKEQRVEMAHILISLCKEEPFRDYGEAVRKLFRVARRGLVPLTAVENACDEAFAGYANKYIADKKALFRARLTAPKPPTKQKTKQERINSWVVKHLPVLGDALYRKPAIDQLVEELEKGESHE